MEAMEQIFPNLGAALLITTGVGFILVRLFSHLARGSTRSGQIEVIETRRIGAKKALLLVRVGRRQLLLGTAEGRINTLCDMNAASVPDEIRRFSELDELDQLDELDESSDDDSILSIPHRTARSGAGS